MNFQDADAAQRWNMGRFLDNGQCGYVLKPKILTTGINKLTNYVFEKHNHAFLFYTHYESIISNNNVVILFSLDSENFNQNALTFPSQWKQVLKITVSWFVLYIYIVFYYKLAVHAIAHCGNTDLCYI